jgi:hypothetical protein
MTDLQTPDGLRRSSSDFGSSRDVLQRSSALSNKVTSVLSASYTDREIQDALEALDLRKLPNTAETRRQLRLAVQGEVLKCNGEIIDSFGAISEVIKRFNWSLKLRRLINILAIESYWLHDSCSEFRMQHHETGNNPVSRGNF